MQQEVLWKCNSNNWFNRTAQSHFLWRL